MYQYTTLELLVCEKLAEQSMMLTELLGTIDPGDRLQLDLKTFEETDYTRLKATMHFNDFLG